MHLVERFKRDVFQHRGRAAVLGVLFVAMVAMSVRAFLSLRPTRAAVVIPQASVPSAEKDLLAADSQARLRESQELWQKLREVKPVAASPAVAFSFDPAFYPPPAVPLENRQPAQAEPAKAPPVPVPVIDLEAIKEARIREQARALVVKSTALGEGMAEPVAIVNQQVLAVGQTILGFRVSAIRVKEVEFTRDGVTVVVKMPDGQ